MPSRASAWQGERIAAGSLAGLGPAELKDMAAGRLMAEIVIEGDDAMHLGAGDIERFGDQRLGCLIDIAEFFLQCVEHRQQRTFAPRMLADAFERDVLIPEGPALMAGTRLRRRHRTTFLLIGSVL